MRLCCGVPLRVRLFRLLLPCVVWGCLRTGKDREGGTLTGVTGSSRVGRRLEKLRLVVHTQFVRISVSLGDKVSFGDGLAVVLLVMVVAAVLWIMLPAKLRDPMTLFTAILAVATIVLAFVSVLQWRTLEKTDETMRAAERPFIGIDPSEITMRAGNKFNRPIIRIERRVWIDYIGGIFY
jgi:hypothetical protein